MVAGVLTQYYNYAAEQLSKAGSYVRAAGQRAYKIVTVETPNPDALYSFKKAEDQFVILTGQAKQWAIQTAYLENDKIRWKRVCNLTYLLIGDVALFRAWRRNDLLLAATHIFPLMFLGFVWFPLIISARFSRKMAPIAHRIADTAQNEPTISLAELKKKEMEISLANQRYI